MKADTLIAAMRAASKKHPELWDDGHGSCNVFDYPRYGGLPKSIGFKLSGDCVDAIQCMEFPFTKKQAAKHLRYYNKRWELGLKF